MVCNIMSGKIYKGSIAEITVPMFPRCYTGETENLVVNFYTEDATSIEFSVSAGTITLDEYFNGTVVFQVPQLGVLEDGLLRYSTTCGEDYYKEWESRYFICTPQNYTPVEYVTEDNVVEVVSEVIGDNYLTVSAASATYATKTEVSNFVTSGDVETTLEDYAKLTDIPSLDGYATEQYVANAITASTQNMVVSTAIKNIWLGTEAQYNALPTKANDTLYLIK